MLPSAYQSWNSAVNLVCSLCGYGFQQQDDLHSHYLTAHPQENAGEKHQMFYGCGACGKGFDTSMEVESHLKNIHNIVVQRPECNSSLSTLTTTCTSSIQLSLAQPSAKALLPQLVQPSAIPMPILGNVSYTVVSESDTNTELQTPQQVLTITNSGSNDVNVMNNGTEGPQINSDLDCNQQCVENHESFENNVKRRGKSNLYIPITRGPTILALEAKERTPHLPNVIAEYNHSVELESTASLLDVNVEKSVPLPKVNPKPTTENSDKQNNMETEFQDVGTKDDIELKNTFTKEGSSGAEDPVEQNNTDIAVADETDQAVVNSSSPQHKPLEGDNELELSNNHSVAMETKKVLSEVDIYDGSNTLGDTVQESDVETHEPLIDKSIKVPKARKSCTYRGTVSSCKRKLGYDSENEPSGKKIKLNDCKVLLIPIDQILQRRESVTQFSENMNNDEDQEHTSEENHHFAHDMPYSNPADFSNASGYDPYAFSTSDTDNCKDSPKLYDNCKSDPYMFDSDKELSDDLFIPKIPKIRLKLRKPKHKHHRYHKKRRKHMYRKQRHKKHKHKKKLPHLIESEPSGETTVQTESVDHKKQTECIENKKQTESVDHKKQAESVDHKKQTESVDHKKQAEIVDYEKQTESKKHVNHVMEFWISPDIELKSCEVVLERLDLGMKDVVIVPHAFNDDVSEDTDVETDNTICWKDDLQEISDEDVKPCVEDLVIGPKIDEQDLNGNDIKFHHLDHQKLLDILDTNEEIKETLSKMHQSGLLDLIKIPRFHSRSWVKGIDPYSEDMKNVPEVIISRIVGSQDDLLDIESANGQVICKIEPETSFDELDESSSLFAEPDSLPLQFMCTKCNKKFSRGRHLELHVEKQSCVESSRIASENRCLYKCSKCFEKFPNLQVLSGHMRHICGVKVPKVSYPVSLKDMLNCNMRHIYYCSQCLQNFPSLSIAAGHFKYTCSFVGKDDPNVSIDILHGEVISCFDKEGLHGKQLLRRCVYECSKCLLIFPSRKVLEGHVRHLCVFDWL